MKYYSYWRRRRLRFLGNLIAVLIFVIAIGLLSKTGIADAVTNTFWELVYAAMPVVLIVGAIIYAIIQALK